MFDSYPCAVFTLPLLLPGLGTGICEGTFWVTETVFNNYFVTAHYASLSYLSPCVKACFAYICILCGTVSEKVCRLERMGFQNSTGGCWRQICWLLTHCKDHITRSSRKNKSWLLWALAHSEGRFMNASVGSCTRSKYLEAESALLPLLPALPLLLSSCSLGTARSCPACSVRYQLEAVPPLQPRDSDQEQTGDTGTASNCPAPAWVQAEAQPARSGSGAICCWSLVQRRICWFIIQESLAYQLFLQSV